MRRRILPFLLSVVMIFSSVTPVNAAVPVVEDYAEDELIISDEETVEVNDSEVSDEKDSYATEEIEKLTEASEELLGNDASEASEAVYDYENKYIYYKVNDENNTAAVCKISNMFDPSVPEKITVNGKEYEVTSILEGACTGDSNITKLDCPWSVKSISSNAINASDCPMLERIVVASDAAIADDILKSYNDANSGLTIYTDKPEGRLIDQLKSYPNIKLKYKYTVTWDWQVAGVEPFVDEQQMMYVIRGELEYPTGGQPDNPGYTFDGWYTDKTYKNKWNINDDNPTRVEDGVANINLYAKWTPNEYDVSIDFLVNGKGYFEEEDFEEDYINEHRYELHQTVTYPDTQYTFDISKLPVPKGIYCEFEGWYTKAEGGEKVTSSTYTVGVDNTAENQGVALYAHYNNTQYSIELDLAGGEFEEGYTYPTSYTYWDEEPLIKIPIPVRKGYTFQHWAKIENGEEEEWAYNLIIRKTDHHKNLKFIAKWQIKPYDIEYAPDYDGGELPEGNPTSYTIEDEISLKPATKIGYEFLGWKVAVKSLGNDNAENPIDGTIINKIPKGTTGWLNLSATFGKKPIIYKISYELNAPGEEINEPENNQYTVNDALIIYPPESNKKGYKFAGWYTDSSLADKYRLPESEGGSQYIKKGTTGDLTLYAKWEEPPKYTIVFDLNGHGEAIESQTVYEGESIEKPEDPSAEGYIFKGWYPGDSSEKWEFDSDIVNNSYADKDNVITLHAKWRNAINPAKNWTELTETPDEIYLDEGVTAEDAAEFASDKINKMISIIIYGGSREEGYLVLSSSGGEGFEELEVRFTYETLVEELIPMVNIEPYASMYGIYVIGTTSNALGESEPRVDEVSLSLSEGTIGINFYMKNVSALADGNTYISVGGKESLITAPENGNKFVYSGFVNAKDMDKDIEVKIYRKGEGDSIDIIPLKNESADSNGIFKYSVNDYLERVRGRSDELGTLATAMQNYGLCSQYYFSNEEKGTLPSVASEIDYENYKANIGEILPEGFSYAGSSLILTSSTSIRHYFRADDISKLTFKVNGVDKTDTVVAMNGMYYIEIQGINSTNLDEKHSFAVSDGSKTFEMEYCALSYCEKVTSKSSNEVLKTLANSLYWYNKAAKDYFN